MHLCWPPVAVTEAEMIESEMQSPDVQRGHLDSVLDWYSLLFVNACEVHFPIVNVSIRPEEPALVFCELQHMDLLPVRRP